MSRQNETDRTAKRPASPKACFTREGQPQQTGLLKHHRHAFNQSPKDKAIKQQTAILLQKQPDSKMDG
ncbi:hypothetical protein [Bacteroides gallinaceum]|uniref:Uncharacterized protein n=2 Tax=Bacteroidaceae TaxID=815 RepID=A0ABT7VCS0_9BACE|nr:hypothetical protein [Bacteroides gallinaceum]MBU3857203.1 hypothetical protein [Candidatus Phocaeicola excrementipullorum]MDM8324095.1 hypothetical protein [Bacteroides gallinaceum]